MNTTSTTYLIEFVDDQGTKYFYYYSASSPTKAAQKYFEEHASTREITIKVLPITRIYTFQQQVTTKKEVIEI